MIVDVLIVGAGPAGLAAAIELRRLGVERVLVVDREAEAGGVPRHSAHTGYGLRDLRRVMTGPDYARHYARAAAAAGVEIRAATTLTGWIEPPSDASDEGTGPVLTGPVRTAPAGVAAGTGGGAHGGGVTVPAGERGIREGTAVQPDGAAVAEADVPADSAAQADSAIQVDRAGHADRAGRVGRAAARPWGRGAPSLPISATLTSAVGIEIVTARAVLLATGCRERPRAARLVPGDRPSGVMTTGELQQRVYLNGERLPRRALVVGAEHVSFSAMVTLVHAGADVVALVTEQPAHQSYAAFALAATARWHTPVWASTAVRWVVGRGQLEGVELADLLTGETRFVSCGTLVFTGDWIPDHELARHAGVPLDPGTRGPTVDTALETSVPDVFAAGNLVHAAETADVAALGGRHAARGIAAALRAREPLRTPRIPVTVAAPLRWVCPNAVRILGPPPPRGHFLLRSDVFQRRAQLEVSQNGRTLAVVRARLVPTRPVHLDAGWMTRIERGGGPVRIALR